MASNFTTHSLAWQTNLMNDVKWFNVKHQFKIDCIICNLFCHILIVMYCLSNKVSSLTKFITALIECIFYSQISYCWKYLPIILCINFWVNSETLTIIIQWEIYIMSGLRRNHGYLVVYPLGFPPAAWSTVAIPTGPEFIQDRSNKTILQWVHFHYSSW